MGNEGSAVELPKRHPVQGEGVTTAFKAVYNWNYESETDKLRELYAKSLNLQWIAMRDLDWEQQIDQDKFSRTFSIAGMPIQETSFWENLDQKTRWEISRRTAAFMLSNFLHGEQGALMVASQLVNAVPDMDGKFYAATQTLDEARHVEVFAAYINKLDHVYDIAPALKKLLDGVLATDDWMKKAIGMNIVTEGLALYSFRDMRMKTEEPLLEKMLIYVTKDEARHTGFGVQYLSDVVPRLSDEQKAELEDFAFESARLLVDSRIGLSMRESIFNIFGEAGVDPQTAIAEILKDREKLRAATQERSDRRGPVRGFVIPTLRRLGLFSDRTAGNFQEMFVANFGQTLGNLEDDPREMPEDLEAWVLAGV